MNAPDPRRDVLTTAILAAVDRASVAASLIQEERAAALAAAPNRPADLPADDAKLIELAREFVEGEREQARLMELAAPIGSPERDAANKKSDAIGERLDNITEEAVTLRARTRQGHQAKAAMLRDCLRFVRRGTDNPHDWGHVEDRVSGYQHALAWSLVRDMVEGGAAVG